MTAQTLSEVFLSNDRIGKIVSLTELEEKRKAYEAELLPGSMDKLRLAFNRNAAMRFIKNNTIVAFRASRNHLAANNMRMGIYAPHPTNKAAHDMDMNTRFASGMALSGLVDLVNPHQTLRGESLSARQARILIKAFDACENYAPHLKQGLLKQKRDIYGAVKPRLSRFRLS